MEPIELLERLVALVPAPRRKLLRYHGTLAPNRAWRRRVVPGAVEAGAEGGAGAGTGRGGEGHGAEGSGGRCPGGGGPSGSTSPATPRRSDWIPWAELLRRVYAEDVLECPRCGGRMRIVAAVTNPEGINRILEHLRLPPRAPPVAPARVGAQDW